MKKLLAYALLSAGLATQAAAAPLKGDATAGEAKAAACAACHGADGTGGGANPSLAGQGEKYLVKQLQQFKSGVRVNGIMQGMAAGLSDQDMADLAAFYAGKKAPVGQAKPELVKRGERLYRGGDASKGLAACAGCHNPAGKGIPLAGYPRLGGQHVEYTTAQLKAFRAAGRGDHVDDSQKRTNDGVKKGEPGPMQMIAAKLSDDDIEALASFISGLY